MYLDTYISGSKLSCYLPSRTVQGVFFPHQKLKLMILQICFYFYRQWFVIFAIRMVSLYPRHAVASFSLSRILSKSDVAVGDLICQAHWAGDPSLPPYNPGMGSIFKLFTNSDKSGVPIYLPRRLPQK